MRAGNMTETANAPRYLLLPDRVYRLKVTPAENSHRAFHRDLVDYRVQGINPLQENDNWQTFLGMSSELVQDYPSFQLGVPLEWLLFRFLHHHVRTNSVHLLSGKGGEVLTRGSCKQYLGQTKGDRKAEESLRLILESFIRTLPEEQVQLSDMFASTDLSHDAVLRAVNSLKFQSHLEECDAGGYTIKPNILSFTQTGRGLSVSVDRRSNRYYQEIEIQAAEPFCFVIMPFREEEFPQRFYTEVIKPLVEQEYRVDCRRVDEDKRPDRIDNKIYTYLLRATFVVAEITTQNPNVLYELGLAHMLEKDCILLTQTKHEETPFDINRISVTPYATDEELRDCLRRSISALAFRSHKNSG